MGSRGMHSFNSFNSFNSILLKLSTKVVFWLSRLSGTIQPQPVGPDSPNKARFQEVIISIILIVLNPVKRASVWLMGKWYGCLAGWLGLAGWLWKKLAGWLAGWPTGWLAG